MDSGSVIELLRDFGSGVLKDLTKFIIGVFIGAIAAGRVMLIFNWKKRFEYYKKCAPYERVENMDKAVELYIEPLSMKVGFERGFSSKKTSHESTPLVRKIVDEYIKRGVNFHLIVVADSGMGKSLLLRKLIVNELGIAALFRRKINYLLLPLYSADIDVLKEIREWPSKSGTYLLLDALDEDLAAIKEPSSRLLDVRKAAINFSGLIITCREQFIYEIKGLSEIVRDRNQGVRALGASGDISIEMLEILKFDPARVRRFIRGAIPLRHYGLRRKVIKLCDRSGVKGLVSRPMLLQFMPDIYREISLIRKSGVDAFNLFKVYQLVVKWWVEREVSGEEDGRKRRWELLRASRVLANELQFSGNWSQGVESSEAIKILRKFHIEYGGWHLRNKSLMIPIGSNARLVFAHRSIMEFLLVINALPPSVQVLDWEKNKRLHMLPRFPLVFTDEMVNITRAWVDVAESEQVDEFCSNLKSNSSYEHVVFKRFRLKWSFSGVCKNGGTREFQMKTTRDALRLRLKEDGSGMKRFILGATRVKLNSLFLSIYNPLMRVIFLSTFYENPSLSLRTEPGVHKNLCVSPHSNPSIGSLLGEKFKIATMNEFSAFLLLANELSIERLMMSGMVYVLRDMLSDKDEIGVGRAAAIMGGSPEILRPGRVSEKIFGRTMHFGAIAPDSPARYNTVLFAEDISTFEADDVLKKIFE